MPKPKTVVKAIESYFYKRRNHTARILSGPKRETWFSAECFVALAQREISEEGPLTHWGEITHRKMAKKLKASPGAGVLSKLPDVAAILPAGGNAAVSLIIENKVILGGEKPEGTIENLKEQMLNAQNVWPGASIVGLIFVAAVSHAKKPKYSDRLRRVVATTDKVFDGVLGFRWVRQEKVHRIFDEVGTRFAYPAMHFSLALCSIELSSQVAAVDESLETAAEPQAPPPVIRSPRTRPTVPKPRRSPKWDTSAGR